jgi:hypothetical protein
LFFLISLRNRSVYFIPVLMVCFLRVSSYTEVCMQRSARSYSFFLA